MNQNEPSRNSIKTYPARLSVALLRVKCHLAVEMSHKFWKPGTAGPGQHLLENAASAEDRPATENQSSLNDDLNSTIVFNSNSSLAMDQQRQR